MTITIKMSGPLFDTGGSQAVSTIKNLSYNMLDEISRAGIEKLHTAFSERPEGVFLNVATAHGVRGESPSARGTRGSAGYRKTIHALVSNMNMTILDNNAVYGPWLEGTGSRNETSQFKGYATFRKVGDWIESDFIPRIQGKYESLLAEGLNGV